MTVTPEPGEQPEIFGQGRIRMYCCMIAALWSLAGLWGGLGLGLASWSARAATPPEGGRGWRTTTLLWFAMAPAGGVFGFGLALLLDSYLGGWGILLAAVLSLAACLGAAFLSNM